MTTYRRLQQRKDDALSSVKSFSGRKYDIFLTVLVEIYMEFFLSDVNKLFYRRKRRKGRLTGYFLNFASRWWDPMLPSELP